VSYLRQLRAVIWKDLIVELRTRERILATGSFVVLTALLFNYATDRTVVKPQDIAAGLTWMTLVFSALLAVGRTFQLEAEDDAFQGVLMSPIPKDALYLAKVAANFLLVLGVSLLVLGVFALFFDLDYGGRPLLIIGVLALGALGFVALAILFAALSSATTMGETLLPVLLFPLLVPMIIYGTQATARLMADRPWVEISGLVRMLGAFTLVALFSGAVLFRHVVEE
jgi:heme exporter protein B